MTKSKTKNNSKAKSKKKINSPNKSLRNKIIDIENEVQLNKDKNLLPIIIDCIKHNCTLGEICQIMRDVHGEYA